MSEGVVAVEEDDGACSGIAVGVVPRLSQTALQLPTSDQPQSTGTTAARPVRSMTA